MWIVGSGLVGQVVPSAQHALNGNTSPSATGSPPRSVRQRVDLANDGDLEPTLVLPTTASDAAADGPGRPGTDLEARLGRLFVRGRELAGTLIRPEIDVLEMGIVAATEAHRRHILTMVPDGHNRPVIMQVALGALAVYNLRPSDYTPVEEVNILWALEGDWHIWDHKGVLFTFHGFSWRPFEGVFSSSALRRIKAKMVALEGLFRKLGAATGRDRDSIVSRMLALRVPRGMEDDPAMDARWFEHLCASATAVEPSRDGSGDGPARGSPWTVQVVKAIIKCSGEMQNDSAGNVSSATSLNGATPR